MSLVRKPVKSTYAHKRGRALAIKTLSSSPLEDPGQGEVTRSEMSRRMLKRSHRSEHSQIVSERDPHSVPGPTERLSKRIRRVADLPAESPDPNAMTSDDMVPFNANDISQFQTPDSSNSMPGTAIEKAARPEQWSPIPVASRILSRTSSRNLKENSTVSRGLASPFNSRPGSAASSPKGKAKSKRHLPKANSHALFDKKNLDADVSLTVHHNARRSPGLTKTGLHNRRPSVPAPAHMIQQMTHQDWLVPPKALSRAFLTDDMNSSPESTINPSTFFEDLPVAASTPYHKRTMTSEDGSRIYAPRDAHSPPGLTYEPSIHDLATQRDQRDDFLMVDDIFRARTPDGHNLTSCSIISHVPSYPNSPSAHEAHDRGPANTGHLKLVTLRNYDLAFPHLRRRVEIDGDDEGDSIISPLRRVDHIVQLPPPSISQDGLSAAHAPDPFMDFALAIFDADTVGLSDPVIATRPSSPEKAPSAPAEKSFRAPSDKLQDMFSGLILDGVCHAINNATGGAPSFLLFLS
jgi:hypothetical protein